ncbi:MAG: TIGR02757 family protein [Clostridium sp.]|nr:TIGR02757 family protein [Clostridium sp.]
MIRQLLDEAAARINSPSFIDLDPVQFPRRFSDLRDIEIVALLSATVAWGNRAMICRNCEKILSLMDHAPFDYVRDRGFEDLPHEMNIHRTFFAANLRNYLAGLARIYDRHDSLNDFARARRVGDSEFPAWELARLINNEIAEAAGGKPDPRCLPQNLDQTALKRLNMALRWLVRDDGIVDLGVWEAIRPDQLFIPLDVHVGNTARDLGLLTRRSNDRRAVVELTAKLREFRPDDPVLYDYALFGLGIEDKHAKKQNP